MKKLIILIVSITITLQIYSQDSTLYRFLKAIPGAVVVKSTEKGKFNEFYEVSIPQKINHKNPESKTFMQRIFVGHIGFDRPTTIVTEGYSGDYGANGHMTEPAKILNSNQIFVEHRYFSKSVPDSMDWQYLNEEQDAADYHYIRTLFGSIYPQKWISTGISKGGQTTVAYRVYYPNDVDVSIPYVAPINLSKLDKRIDQHFKKVGTKQNRQLITQIQYRLLKNKKNILPLYEAGVTKKGFKFDLMEPEKMYDYSVLEFPFSYWQFYNHSDTLPKMVSGTDEFLAQKLIEIVGPAWYTSQVLKDNSAFYQFYSQLGYYEYNEKPFAKYLKYKDYSNADFVPQNVTIKWDKSYIEKLKKFLKTNPDRMIFIYGELDPWGATHVILPQNSNSLIVTEKNGDHRARINGMNQSQKKLIAQKLTEWLQMPVKIE